MAGNRGCCVFVCIPQGTKWEAVQTMLSVCSAFGTCQLRYNDYLSVMKPSRAAAKLGNGMTGPASVCPHRGMDTLVTQLADGLEGARQLLLYI